MSKLGSRNSTAKELELSQLSLNDLVDSFDDIPLLMSKMKANKSSVKRFPVLGPNFSASIDMVLRGHEPVNSNTHAEKVRFERISDQASKVLEHLEEVCKIDQKQENISTIADKALNKLENKDMKEFFKRLDINKRGKISYKDFNDTLISTCANLSKDDAYHLATKIDKNKTGSIDYMNILNALKEVSSLERPTVSPQSIIEQPSSPRLDKEVVEEIIEIKPTIQNKQANNNAEENLILDTQPLNIPFHNFKEDAIQNYYDALPKSTIKYQFYEEIPIHLRSGKRIGYLQDSKHGCPYHIDASKGRPSSAPPRGRDCSKTSKGYALKETNNDDNVSKLDELGKKKKSNQAYKNFHKDSIVFGNELDDLSRQTSVYISNNASNPNQISKPISIPISKPKVERIKKDRNIKVRAKDLDNETIENSITSQMGGQMATLRLYLRQLDGSKSGHVNFEEFSSALIKAGINTPKAALKDFFYKNAHVAKEINSLDLGSNRLEVNIEHFVSRLQNRLATPGLNLATPESEEAKSAEERRIMKKILNVTSRNANVYSNIFDSDDNHAHRGWVDPLQMKEGLQKLGVNLSHDEYNSLLNRVDLNHNGKISIKGFDSMLNEEINKSHNNLIQLKHNLLKSNSRYNKTFKSSDLIQQNSNPDCGEYETFGNSDVIKKNKLMWSKLKGCLQNQRIIVQKAFSKGYNTYLSNNSRDEIFLELGKLDKEEELTVSQLQSRLTSLGLPLSNEDIDHLDYHIQEKKYETSNFKDNEDNKVSLDSFCDIVGIPVTRNVKNEKQLEDPRLTCRDGGIYSSSILSQHGSSTYHSTMFDEGNEEKSIWVKGNTKRKVPLSEFATEPSKFWTLDRGDENPEFFFGQSPLPSFRDCGQQMNHIRGLPTSPTSRQSRRVKSSIEVDDSVNIGGKKEFYKFNSELDDVPGFKSLKGDNSIRTRSSSAPCRTQRNMKTRTLGDFMEVKSRLGLEDINDENSNSLSNFVASDKWKETLSNNKQATGYRVNLSGGTECRATILNKNAMDERLCKTTSLKKYSNRNNQTSVVTAPYAVNYGDI